MAYQPAVHDDVSVDGYSGVAFYVFSVDEEAEEAVVIMVGDDRRHTVSFDELSPLSRGDYCGVCGQIGCSHDGYEE
jgi:viroplasmin and RNaseH domain-containing protein